MMMLSPRFVLIEAECFDRIAYVGMNVYTTRDNTFLKEHSS